MVILGPRRGITAHPSGAASGTIVATGVTSIADWSATGGTLSLSGGTVRTTTPTAVTSITGNSGLGVGGAVTLAGIPNVQTAQFITSNTLTATVAGSASLTSLIIIGGGAGLSALDLTGCTALTSLNLMNNQLTALDLGDQGALTTLDISVNPFPAFDFADVPLLTTLNCNNLSLVTSLDITDLTALETLGAGHCTSMTSIDFTGLNSLEVFDVDDSLLTALDISDRTALMSLIFDHCPNMVTVDCSGCTALTDLRFATCNSLTTLDITGCTALTNIDGANNIGLLSLDLSALVLLNGGGKQILFNNCSNLTSVTVGTFILSDNFILNFASSPLDTTSVDAILAACAAGIGATTSGALTLTPVCAAPTGGASNADFVTLTSAGITVLIT